MTDCCIIRDLLPLCDDDAISEESRKIIEGHLENCSECRAYYQGIHRIPHTFHQEGDRGSYRYSDVARALRHRAILTHAAEAAMLAVSAFCIIKTAANTKETDKSK